MNAPVSSHARERADVVIVGAGAAGLMAGLVCARTARNATVLCLDGARRIGAKILVSGGGRCNVTNRVVDERDFWGGSSRIVRTVLRAFPETRTVEFFRDLGVTLHEEEGAKLFPDSNRARTVLDALLAEAGRLGVTIRSEQRVVDIARDATGFTLQTASGDAIGARIVVLATGGRSLPKSGSDGFGYELATRAGHTIVETTPALAPLVLTGNRHRRLSGVSQKVRLNVVVNGRAATSLEGALLWTHFGISGPVALDASRHWHRARLNGHQVGLLLNVCPDDTFESLEEWLIQQQRERPRALVANVLASRLPTAVAQAWVEGASIGDDVTMAHLPRDERRGLIRALVELPLDVHDSRGYGFAEVTAGGVSLDEIDPARMESRLCRGLYLVGEVLDVDGRLGGFNFQWAWSTGWVAGRAIAAALQEAPGEVGHLMPTGPAAAGPGR